VAPGPEIAAAAADAGTTAPEAPWDRLFTRPSGAELHVRDGRQFRRTTWSERVVAAERVAAHLRRRHGVTHGEPVGCVLENSVEAIDAVLGVWLAGGIVLSLPALARGMGIEERARQIQHLVAHAEASLVLMPGREIEEVSTAVRAICRPYGSLGGSQRLADPPGASETCFVQYSSGVTAQPKGCALTPAAIANQLAALGEALRLSSEDRFSSWLPLAHDMGFFGTFMLPWWHDLPACLSSPARFAASPRSWLEDCAEFRATISAAPNFALDLAARSVASRPLGKTLDLRALVVGAEPIQWRSLSRIADALSNSGLAFESITPAYGLAEATLAVTVGRLQRAPTYTSVRRDKLWAWELEETSDDDPRAVRCVTVGAPIPGTTVRIDGGGVGEVLVSSSSLAEGYFKAPEPTAARFTDGVIRTGDLGFIRDEELYIVGRTDDMLIVAGRNLFAGELEAPIEAKLGLGSGRVAVVATGDSRTQLVALVEHVPPSRTAARSLAAAADEAAIAHAGVGIDKCVFLHARALPRSASGKLQRPRAEAIAAGDSNANIAATVAVRNA